MASSVRFMRVSLLITSICCALSGSPEPSADASQFNKYAQQYLPGDGKSQPAVGNYQGYMDKYVGAGGPSNLVALDASAAAEEHHSDKHAKEADHQHEAKSEPSAEAEKPTDSQTGPSEGGYQQYTNKYAGDYQKYMGRSGGNSSNEYAQKYTGGNSSDSYSQYAQKYTGGGQGDYQDYMKKYGGDYQQYMHMGGQNQEGDKQHMQTDAGNYQKYMAGYQKYVSDYAKYMQTWAQPAQGSQGHAGVGDYQQYVQTYAGDYQKYMQNSGQQSSPAGQKTGGASGDYQQYMQGNAGDYQKYMADYQKFWHGGAQPSQEGSTSAGSSDYQQYTQGYAGDYQKYMADYQKYMHMQGQGQEAASAKGQAQPTQAYAGDYQKYMADYAKFTQGAGQQQAGEHSSSSDAHAGGYSQYMTEYAGDYKKYMQDYAGGQKSQQAGYAGDYKKYAGQHGDYQKFLEQYASDYAKYAHQVEQVAHLGAQNATELGNVSEMAAGYEHWKQTYMDKYAADFKHFIKEQASQEAQADVPPSAHDCENMTQLLAWRNATLKRIREYVPKAYLSKAEDGVERVFHSNEARIANLTSGSLENEHSHPAASRSESKHAAHPAAQVSQEVAKPARQAEAAPVTSAALTLAETRSEEIAPAVQEITPSHLPFFVVFCGVAGTFVAFSAAFLTRRQRQQQSLESEGYMNLGEP